MVEQLPKRSAVDPSLTWDLTHLYATEADFEDHLAQAPAQVKLFKDKYENQLVDARTIERAIADYEELSSQLDQLGQYASLPTSVDITDSKNSARLRKTIGVLSELSAELSFFEAELIQADESVLDEVVENDETLGAFIRQLKKAKKVALDPKVEESLKLLNPVLNSFADIYGQAKGADAEFGSFEVDGKEYPLSFVLYEDYYMYHNDPKVRRASYDKFNEILAQYQNTVANAYYAQVLKEKTLATMRGYDSVTDYLLSRQEVTPEMYHRQIDLIMNDFAPVMRKYITHVKEERGLDRMTYADLKIDIDPEYAVETSIEESRDIIKHALKIMGDDYVDLIMRSFDESWTDYARNVGKESGAFCSSTYGNHPYIMMSYSGLLSDTYTLIHELGHAGQAVITSENNRYSSAGMSTYIVEAPSTFHELLLSHYLKGEAKDARAERDVIAKMISKTYFHNFVTHLLEAAYQREVYALIDRGESFGASELNAIKRQVLEDFWGDAVEIESGAELTWMRQQHYYMGLYPYTYSAGLTVATQAYLKLVSGEISAENWIDFLKVGQKLEPAEAVKLAHVDIDTDQALKDTIAYLDQSIDRMIELTEEIKK